MDQINITKDAELCVASMQRCSIIAKLLEKGLEQACYGASSLEIWFKNLPQNLSSNVIYQNFENSEENGEEFESEICFDEAILIDLMDKQIIMSDRDNLKEMLISILHPLISEEFLTVLKLEKREIESEKYEMNLTNQVFTLILERFISIYESKHDSYIYMLEIQNFLRYIISCVDNEVLVCFADNNDREDSELRSDSDSRVMCDEISDSKKDQNMVLNEWPEYKADFLMLYYEKNGMKIASTQLNPIKLDWNVELIKFGILGQVHEDLALVNSVYLTEIDQIYPVECFDCHGNFFGNVIEVLGNSGSPIFIIKKDDKYDTYDSQPGMTLYCQYLNSKANGIN